MAELKEAIVHGTPLAEEPGIGSLTLAGIITEVSQRYADCEALAEPNSEGEMIRWSYQMLYQQSRKVAKALIANGLVKGGRVGILMSNSLEWVAAAMGISLAGGVIVALNTFATRRELDHFIRHSDLCILLMHDRILKQDFLGDLLELCPELTTSQDNDLHVASYPFLRRVVVHGDTRGLQSVKSWQAFIEEGKPIEDALLDSILDNIVPADEGVVFFSSGSTALPKGIIHSHKAVSIQWWRWLRMLEFDPHVRTWTPNGFFWSGNFCVLLGATLVCGGCVVLQRYFQVDEALKLIEDEKISFPFVWPHQMVSMVESPRFLETDFSASKFIDEAWPLAKHPTVKTRPWRCAANSFGCSETITINCCYPASVPVEVSGESHGLPLPGNTLKIVDPLSGEVKPVGESGEICIKGPTLMSGYLRIPLDESLDSEGFYRTGDGGYVDEQGRLNWQGRINDVIKTGGANVSPVEVDNVIQEYPGVKVAHTVGVPHETLGEEVVACIVCIEGHELKHDDLTQFIRERLASYKRPRHILELQHEDLTFTANAKVRIDALREKAIQILQQR